MTTRVVRPRPRPQARRMLVCLSFAGGGTSPFCGWAEHLPEDVELALICYPGRERRTGEPFAPSWAHLVADTAVGIAEAVGDRPYVLFGHSMGGAVAATLASLFKEQQPPTSLVLSATRSPGSNVKVTLTADATDEEYVRWMRGKAQVPDVILEHPELRQMAVSLLRADITALTTFRLDPKRRITMPTQVLYGEQDDITEEVALGWKKVVTGDLSVKALPGGHFYVPEVWERLPHYISALREDG